LLNNQGKQVKLLLEDDEKIPSNFGNIAGIPRSRFQTLFDDKKITGVVLAQTETFIYVSLDKCFEEIIRQIKCWDIGDEYNKFVSVPQYACCTLDWWQNWVNHYKNEASLIMDSAFMQNPINEMIFRGATNSEIELYIRSIAELLKPLSPVCIYLRRESAVESISFAKDVKGNNWANVLDRALIRLNCPDLFERRFELEPLLASSITNVICDIKGSDWSKAKEKISNYFAV